MRRKSLLKSGLLLALALVLVLSATACSSSSDTAAAKLVIGVDDSYPPMEYRDENNTLIGFDIDMTNALAEKLGMEVEYVSTAWDGIFQGLNAGKYDAIISSVSMTNARLEEFEFTKPYLANGQVIVVAPDDDSISTPEDLAGKRVGVQLSTTADEAVQKQLEKTEFEVTKYDDIMQTFTAMEAGRIDAIVVDAAVAMDYVAKSPDKFKISSAQLTNEPISICLKKGNTELQEKLQGALDELKEDGTLKDISIKWFGDDYTSNIDETLY
ncbi:MAG: polar amino acid transport system substrate-binding protein [Clostridiales bacterium]|jgi:polar amino acid transport system substrate-binding protein|nr:polar amino acid transport system substrate-binding protein [Clostridiales bacterium]